MHKKIIASTVLSLTLVLGVFTGCQSENEKNEKPIETPVVSHSSTTQKESETPTLQKKFVLTFNDEVLELDKAPEKICAFSYPLSNIMEALEIPLSATMKSSRPMSDYLKQVPIVGTALSPDMELLKQNEIDLFIASETLREKNKPVLDEAKIPNFYFNITLYSQTKDIIKSIGVAFDKSEKANELVNEIIDRENKILDSIKNKEKPRIAIIFGTSKSFMFNTESSYVGEIAKLLGMSNIITNYPENSSSVNFSIEQLIAEDPDVILRVSHGGSWEDVKKNFDDEFNKNKAFDTLSAVKNDKVYDLEAELFTANAGIRAIESFEQLAKIVYGE